MKPTKNPASKETGYNTPAVRIAVAQVFGPGVFLLNTAQQHPILRFVPGALPPGRSTRSDDWRLARLRCRRENIRGIKSSLATRDRSEISRATRKAAAAR